MKWTYNNLDSADFISVATCGRLSEDSIVRLFDHIFSRPCWRFGMPLLLDHRKLDMSNVSPAQLMRAADAFVKFNDRLTFTRISIIHAARESIEIAQRYGLIADDRTAAHVKRFTDDEEAINWLLPNRGRHQTAA